MTQRPLAMKHDSARAVVLLAALSIAGCGEENAKPAPENTSGSARATATPSVPQKQASATAAATGSAGPAGPSASTAEAPPSASASAAAEPPPYDGKLTMAMVMGADRVARPFDEWDDAMKRMKVKVGPPTLVKGDQHCWAAAEGDQCTPLCIEKTTSTKLRREGKDRPMVGATDHPQTYGKDMEFALEACLEKTKGYKPPAKKKK